MAGSENEKPLNEIPEKCVIVKHYGEQIKIRKHNVVLHLLLNILSQLQLQQAVVQNNSLGSHQTPKT